MDDFQMLIANAAMTAASLMVWSDSDKFHRKGMILILIAIFLVLSAKL